MRKLLKLFVLVSVVMILTIWSAIAGPNEGAQLRSFLQEVILNTGQDPTLQPDSLRKTFAKHANLLPLLLDQKEFSKLLADADLQGALTMVTQGNEIRYLLEDGIVTQVSLWLRTLEKVAGLPAEQSERVYLARRFVQKASNAKQTEKILSNTRKTALEFSKEFMQTTEGERYSLLRIMPDAAFRNFSDRFNAKITKSNFSKLGILDMVLDEKSGIQIPGLNKAEAEELNNSFRKYFDHLAIDDKRKIIASWMALPPGSSMEVQLAEVLQNSGPAMQKMFQLFGRDSPSPQVKEIMKELLSNVKPFDTATAKKMIEQAYKKPIEEIFSFFDDKPLAAGTIGQVHRAQLKDGSWVVVKVQRPGIEAQMQREFVTLAKVSAGNPIAQKLINRLKKNFLEELDFQQEEANFRALQAYANPKLGLQVPHLVESLPAKKVILVTELVPGKPLASVENIAPEIRGQAVYNALTRWFDEVMFDSGFFHGDMHPGNMLLDLRLGKKPPFQLSVIDPGSAGKLSFEQRRGLVRLYFSVLSKSPDRVIEALEIFQGVPKDQATFRKELAKIFEKKSDLNTALQDIMKSAVVMGAEMDSSLVMFQRANSFLEKELENINAELLAKNPKAKLFRAENAYYSVGLKRAGIQIPKQFFSQKARNEAVVETAVLRTYFLDKMKAHYLVVKNRCAVWFGKIK